MVSIDIVDAGHGDCLLLTCNKIRVLIDSGPRQFKIRTKVYKAMEKLLDGEEIDFAVVTHNDDDHIGGYEYFLKNGIIIRKFIFNSSFTLKNIFNIKKISYKQDNDLTDFLNMSDIDYSMFFDETIPIIIDDVKITAITPSKMTLERLFLSNPKNKSNKKISSRKVSENDLSYYLNKIKIGDDHFEKDSSFTNKSSISFVVEYNGKNFLFLGDSHADDVINGLKQKGYINTNFDFVKISHHGSHKNTSSELINIIGHTDYIICADGSKNNHPNKLTIARILSFNPSPKILMSSDNIKIRSIFIEAENLGFNPHVIYNNTEINRVIYE